MALAGISRWCLGVIAGHGGALLLWLLLHSLNCLEDKHYKRKENEKVKRRTSVND